MTEEVIKEVITSTPASAAPKSEDQPINSPDTIDANSAPPDLKRKKKPAPHYLRASTSSCHDNCKFGIQHSSESKKHWPVRRAQLRRASTGNQERHRVEIILPQRVRSRKEDQELKCSGVKDDSAPAPAKPALTNPKAPLESLSGYSESNHCLQDLSTEASEPAVARTLPIDAECCIISHEDVADFGDGELSDGPVSIELEMPLAIQDSDASEEHMGSAILPSADVRKHGEKSLADIVSDQSANDCANSEKRITLTVTASEKHEQPGLGTKSRHSANESGKPKAKATSTVTRNPASSHKTARTSHPKAPGDAVEIPKGPKTTRKKADASVTTSESSREKKFSPIVTSAVPKVKAIKVPSPSNPTDSSAKPARLAKLKDSTTKHAASPPSSTGKTTDRKMTMANVVKNAQVLQNRVDDKLILRTLKLSRSVNMPAKSSSSVKVRAVRKEKIAPPSKKVSGTENSVADAKNTKEKVLKTASPKVQKPEVHRKDNRPCKEKTDTPITRTARGSKPAPIVPASTPPQPSPRKLTFRRGKVLNPDASSSSTLRRLRFRPAMAAADTTVRIRGVTGRRTGGSAAGRDAGASRAEVVVLRRRQGGGGDGKRQEQVLLNNVIEETASRLVAEARKSKVKALVGAFETVISLQEGGKAAPPAAAAGAATVAP